MIFENNIIEFIIDRERIHKYIFFDDVCLYFFDISCDDEKTNYQNNDSKYTSKESTRITKKSKPTDNISSKVYYQKKHHSKTYKISEKSYKPRRETGWEYRRKKNRIRRIAARKYWTQCSAESNRSPDAFSVVRILERILREFFDTCDIHQPGPHTWKNKGYRKENQESSCDIIPHNWININQYSRSFEK